MLNELLDEFVVYGGANPYGRCPNSTAVPRACLPSAVSIIRGKVMSEFAKKQYGG
jgi:hypothetical protein